MRFLALLTYHWINCLDITAHEPDHMKGGKTVGNIGLHPQQIAANAMHCSCHHPTVHFHLVYKTLYIILFMNSVLSYIIHLSSENVNAVFCQTVLRIYRLTEELQIQSTVFLFS